MAAIDNADVIECKNEVDHLWKEATNLTFYDNSEINIKSDKPIGCNVIEEGSLKETNIRITKESVENINYIEISVESVKNDNDIETTEKADELEEMAAIGNADVRECKNVVNHLWEPEINLTFYDNCEINIKSELDETPIDSNINEEVNVKETVENFKIISIKNECFENVNNIEIPEENVKNGNHIEITENTVKNLSNIKILYNLPVEYEGELHSKIPEGSLHCERSALRCASQEALDDHKKWSAKHADERTVKIIPRPTQPVVVNGVQFGAPFKKPKADLKQSKTSNEESVKTVNSDANISGLHLEEGKDVANYTETVVGDKTNSLIVTPFLCKKCGEKFSRKHDFRRHMTTHTGAKPYSCTVCSKQFSQNSDLNKHMRTHTGEKPYSCTVCEKKFSRNSCLNIHMRRHTGENPYSCMVCNKQFSQSGHLDRHMRIHTGEKPYSCTLCSRQFITGCHLDKHIRTHTGEKPYSCTVCKKQFTTNGYLKYHMKTHTGEKPYSCTVCSKQFITSGNLSRHMRTHTGEKPYSCLVCKKLFSDISSRWRHSKKCQ